MCNFIYTVTVQACILLDFNMMEFTVQLFKLEEFTDEEVAEAMSHLRVSNVNHVIVNVEVQLK